jgi:hypothetical protein
MKEIDILKEQIARLEEKRFDLEAWKAHTLIYISRIFGEGSEHARLINNLRYDYSSWNLRDTSGGIKLTDPIRVQAHEILNAAIHELEVFGLADKTNETHRPLLEAFSNELTGREQKELEKILGMNAKEREKALQTFIDSKNKETLVAILLQLFRQS